MISDYFNKNRAFLSNEGHCDRILMVDGAEYFIYIPNTKDKYNKPEPDIFWHIASIGEEEFGETGSHGDFLLCANTIFTSCCSSECKKHTNVLKDKRIPCLFRADSIKYIPQLIADWNSNKTGCCFWIKDDKAFLRETVDYIDFVVIFRLGRPKNYKGRKVLLLIGAFPLVVHSLKTKFDRDYLKYSGN